MDSNFQKGQLQRWNKDKGFGFIKPEKGKKDIFIHISALKRMSRFPIIGDTITYQIHTDNDGKNRAVNAKITGVTEIKPRIKHKKAKNKSHTKGSSKTVLFILLALAVFFFYNKDNAKKQTFSTATTSTLAPPLLKQPNKENYRCTGKTYCSQMTSCAEARFYLKNCPNTKMDGNHDGIPCQKQWC